jgi:hypothetical protein
MKVRVADQIHFYDVEPEVPDKGWVHYTSAVPGWEGVDCRVADVVRDIRDCNPQTVGFVNAPTSWPDAVTVRLLGEEAVRISRFAPTWLDRIMTTSPLRDAANWRSDGKARYTARRKERRRKFEEGVLMFDKPNQLEEC